MSKGKNNNKNNKKNKDVKNVNYRIKTTINEQPIFSEPNGELIGNVPKGVYYIVNEKIENGTKYGKLKSSNGWIKLSSIKKIL